MEHHYEGAVENFASYYDELGDLNDEAALFEKAAQTAEDDERRAAYLEDAGIAHVNARELSRAESDFTRAIASAPSTQHLMNG